MNCELIQFSNEIFDTGVDEIDNIAASFGRTVENYDILLENGDSLLLETYTITPLVNENFTVNNDIAAADNETFTTEADNVLDFSERNPFGEVFQ